MGISFVGYGFHDPYLVNTRELREHGLPLLDFGEHHFRVKVHVLTFNEKDAPLGYRLYQFPEFVSQSFLDDVTKVVFNLLSADVQLTWTWQRNHLDVKRYVKGWTVANLRYRATAL